MVDPALESIDEVERFCRETEKVALPVTGTEATPKAPKTTSHIDAIVISHEFTDHCHKATLVECDPCIPVIATTKAANLVKGWKHFNCVIETPGFEKDWRTCRSTIQEAVAAAGAGVGAKGAAKDQSTVSAWPDWVGVGRVVTKSDKFYYHSAVMVLFDLSASASAAPLDVNGQEEKKGPGSEAEAVIYTPHGIHPESLESLSSASPPISTLALLHGLHDVSIDWGQQLNLGAHNGLAAQKVLNARWWIGTHDEEKKGGGIVSWFLRRKKIPLQDAMGKVAEAEGDSLDEVNFVDAESGQSLVLVDRA